MIFYRNLKKFFKNKKNDTMCMSRIILKILNKFPKIKDIFKILVYFDKSYYMMHCFRILAKNNVSHIRKYFGQIFTR